MVLNLLTCKTSESSATSIRKLQELEFLNIIFEIQGHYDSDKNFEEIISTLIT